MMPPPGAFDYAVLALMVAATVLEWQWYWPRCVRAVREGAPGVRMRAYRNIVIAEWAFTAYVLGVWIAKNRPWTVLWLEPLGHARLGIGLLFAAAMAILLWLRNRRILASAKMLTKVREKLAFADALVPDTDGERRAFWFVSVTAGICEEIIARGFLMWLIGAWTGLPLAIILSSILFGFGHIYLGISHVLQTAVVGLVFALIVVASGSLLPAMIIHAAVDLTAGELGFHARRAAMPINPSPEAVRS
jgi:uncharacterized protein